MKTTAEIRRDFLDFFARRDHRVVPSSRLVPANDPTLLFTSAGMVQFKDVFLGAEKRNYTRATSAQRCLRAGGKHNDLDQVGYTARHHTFFEMLGNFSFGDYFKKEAIEFAWEFLTETCGLPAGRLWVTVYEQDPEAEAIWLEHIGVDPSRFSRIGEKDNFWAMGETGPCGPCTEIFYDHGPDVPGGPPGTPEEDGDRYVEIWNLVFMQYDRAADGTLSPLPAPCVDTGMGLERLAAVLQGVHDNYDIDLFKALIRAAGEYTGTADLTHPSLKVIADHIRACAFLITDGVLPGNEGRGYVLRRIIRRAIRHGYKLGCKDLFFHRMVQPLAEQMGEAYPELVEQRAGIEAALAREERRFGETLDRGMRHLEDRFSLKTRVFNYLSNKYGRLVVGPASLTGDPSVERYEGVFKSSQERTVVEVAITDNGHLAARTVANFAPMRFMGDRKDREIVFVQVCPNKADTDLLESVNQVLSDYKNAEIAVLSLDEIPTLVSGDDAFELYDTYGFPLDLTQDIARERGLRVDQAGFDQAMQAQRERARAAGQFAATDAISSEVAAGLAPTAFLGYQQTEAENCRVLVILVDGKPVDVLEAGQGGSIILDRTPFYAESGGQVGDTGELTAAGARFAVSDTRKLANAFHAHTGEVTAGRIETGMQLSAHVDAPRRADIIQHHSATHLLHAALRQVLGEHVQQKGSLVAPDRLRFDFSHFEPVSADQLAEIERRVNQWIQSNAEAEERHLGFDEAIQAGALAFFDDKYGDEVRVLRFGDVSMELCGGTHVARMGDIGVFKIIAETGISAGVRRIEALAGRRAVNWIQDLERTVRQASGRLKISPEQLEQRITQLLERSREMEKELERLQSKLASAQGADLAEQAEDIDGVKVLAARLDGVDPGALRDTVDQLKNKLGSAIVVLGAVSGDEVRLVVGVTGDLTGRFRAGDLVKHIAAQIGGRGGGRPDFAQAGGTDPGALSGALQSVSQWVRERAG